METSSPAAEEGTPVNGKASAVGARPRSAGGRAKACLACMGMVLVVAGLSVKDSVNQAAQKARASSATMVPNVTAADVLAGRSDLRGSRSAAYTLVEFGDYECPPCRGHQALLSEVLRRLPGRVKLDFRQMPLTQIHPHAQEAARAAESARVTGRFWTVHDQLLAADLEPPGAVAQILKRNSVSPSAMVADKRIASDGRLAKRLGVRATPTFVLLTPGGNVYRAPSLDAAEAMIR